MVYHRSGWRRRAPVLGCGVGADARAGDVSGRRPMTFADLQRMKRVSDRRSLRRASGVMFSVTEVDLRRIRR